MSYPEMRNIMLRVEQKIHPNPVIPADYAPNDLIRVDHTYYMISTTMHFYPGGAILKSEDLVHWELASYLFDELENTMAEHLEGEQNIYGSGLRVSCIRYHKGFFYVLGLSYALDTAYLFLSENIEGPWEKRKMDRCYHDGSLLFDEDGRNYLIFGSGNIYMMELNETLTGPKPNGFQKLIIPRTEKVFLNYEGANAMKRNGKYYVFLTCWPTYGTARRIQTCFMSNSKESSFQGKVILDDDRNFYNEGISEGGLVETPDGKWFAILTQDFESAGRFPILSPVTWKDDYPEIGMNGKIPEKMTITISDKKCEPLWGSDRFEHQRINSFWQWNHQPDLKLISIRPQGGLLMTTDKISINLLQAVNVLTQRMCWPRCDGTVTVSADGLNNGDIAGISAFIGGYGLIGITKDNGKYYIVETVRDVKYVAEKDRAFDYMPGREIVRIPWNHSSVRLRVSADFSKFTGLIEFYLEDITGWTSLEPDHRIYYNLDHFSGCRFGLFCYSTRMIGGSAVFNDFEYR